MGQTVFTARGVGDTIAEAFNNAVEYARYQYGHAGYTGTIAEKTSFVIIPLPEGRSAESYAYELLDNSDERINDKWGPAGAIKSDENEWLFFGWASW